MQLVRHSTFSEWNSPASGSEPCLPIFTRGSSFVEKSWKVREDRVTSTAVPTPKMTVDVMWLFASARAASLLVSLSAHEYIRWWSVGLLQTHYELKPDFAKLRPARTEAGILPLSTRSAGLHSLTRPELKEHECW